MLSIVKWHGKRQTNVRYVWKTDIFRRRWKPGNKYKFKFFVGITSKIKSFTNVQQELPVSKQHTDIGKSTGPRSSTGENSGGPMKTLSVPVLLSGKKSCCKESLYGDSNVKKKIGPIKSFGGPVKLGFSMWLPVLRSGKGPKVFPMSEHMPGT